MRAAALTLLCVAACEHEPKPLPKAAVAQEKAIEQVTALPKEPPFRGPRVLRASQGVTSNGNLVPEERGEPGQVFGLAAGQELELELASGAQVEVTGPALIAISARSEHGLLVHHGLLRVELPPGAAKSGPPDWIASPALRLEVPRAARFALRVDEAGRAQIAIVGGRITVDLPSLPAEGASKVDLDAGRQVTASPLGALEESAGPATLETAMALLATPSRIRPARNTDDVEQRLRGPFKLELAQFIARTSEAQALDGRHRALVATSDPGAQAVLREIAEKAAQLFRSRLRFEAALSRLEASRLSLTPASSPDPDLLRAASLLR